MSKDPEMNYLEVVEMVDCPELKANGEENYAIPIDICRHQLDDGMYICDYYWSVMQEYDRSHVVLCGYPDNKATKEAGSEYS